MIWRVIGSLLVIGTMVLWLLAWILIGGWAILVYGIVFVWITWSVLRLRTRRDPR